MPTSIFRFYQRHKILNINVNIIAAGFLAILVAKWPVKWVSELFGEVHKAYIVVAAAIIDGVADVLIYYVLHWVANHWRPLKTGQSRDCADDHRKFFRNATLVQFERMALTPVYYGVAMGLMYYLAEHKGYSDHWAFVYGFATGIIVTRILHTSYLLIFAPGHVKRHFQEEAHEILGGPTEADPRSDGHGANAPQGDALPPAAENPRSGIGPREHQSSLQDRI
jgi:hypothetical protein